MLCQFIQYSKSGMINPLPAFHGPGILILTTMPIPDRVRASLQLIHYAKQLPSVVRCIQRASKQYGRVLLCNLVTVWRVPTDGCYVLVRPCIYGHFVGLIHKTVAVLMFWRELKQFACIQSKCHRKLGEQQLNSYTAHPRHCSFAC